MKFGDLASVCRQWRSVIIEEGYLWSTLRVGTWTERDQVTIWSRRARPKKVVIDTQQDDRGSSTTPSFAALQDALATTSQWHELTVSSFPSKNMAGHLSLQGAMPMDVLRSLHVEAGCMRSPSLTHLLDLIPTDGPLSELGLHSSFSTTYFLQPPWFPALQNLTVLIVNGRDIHEPFDLLPAFTRLHTFEANRLPLPWYELDTNLPILCTLHKLQLRASSVQWMAGRQFSCLEECAILLPCRWEAVRQQEVQLPSCRKFTYHGYPMTTAQYFYVPQMRAMELVSHDCNKQRVYQQLRILCAVDGRISRLSALHLTLQCSEQVLVEVLRYLGPLQELVLSISHPSYSWKNFLESLAAKPSTDDWRDWSRSHESGRDDWWSRSRDLEWEEWCSSQTWHANILPHPKYLGIRCLKRSSHSEYLDECLLYRLLVWTRAQLTPPLEHLEVWRGRGTTNGINVNYIFNSYLGTNPGDISTDTMIIRGMITRRMFIARRAVNPITILEFQLTGLFRQLQDLNVKLDEGAEITFLPSLEQIKRLRIDGGIHTGSASNTELPLVHTLQWLRLESSTFSWMLGMTFKTLKELSLQYGMSTPAKVARDEGLQMDLPACTLLKLGGSSTHHLHFLSSPNVESLQLFPSPRSSVLDQRNFLCNIPRLRRLEMRIEWRLEIDPLVQFLFRGAREEGVWRDIRSVEVDFRFTDSSRIEASSFFDQIVGQQQHYERWWKEFKVTNDTNGLGHFIVLVRASM